VVTALAAPAASVAAKTVYVNAVTGYDGWDGLCQNWDFGTCGPKATIQAGLNAAADGDTILVADGVYTGEGNNFLAFAARDNILRSENGPAVTILDGGNAVSAAFVFDHGEGPGTVVEGFTMTGFFDC
jgi:hypothetical protein